MIAQDSNQAQDGNKSSIELFDSLRESFHKNQSMGGRFRLNQFQMKNKFKEYIIKQKLKYPLTNKHYKTQHQDHDSDRQSVYSLKQIRVDKKKMIDDMKSKQNQNNYLQKKKQEQERTFYILKNKYSKIENIRGERKEEITKIRKNMKIIDEEIKKEKRKYRQSIEDSRYRMTQNKMASEERKTIQGQQTRKEKELFSTYMAHEKNQERAVKKVLCQKIRISEQSTHLTMSRVRQQKKDQANEVKLQKLMRQMAEKEQIKIVSSRISELNSKKKSKINNLNKALQRKIKDFRKSLAERRLTPQRNVRILTRKNFSLNEDINSTNGGFLQRSNIRSYTDEATTQK